MTTVLLITVTVLHDFTWVSPPPPMEGGYPGPFFTSPTLLIHCSL